MGRLLEMMERGTLVDKPSSDLMLRMMRGQLYRTRIPRYVTGYTIPHKTGDFLPYVGDDVGMLEAPGKTIILSVFTGNHFGSGEALENAIGLVAKDVADYFATRSREPLKRCPTRDSVAPSFVRSYADMASYLDSVPFSGIIRIRDMMYPSPIRFASIRATSASTRPTP